MKTASTCSKSIWSFFLAISKGYRVAIISIFILGLGWTLDQAAWPVLLSKVIDTCTQLDDKRDLAWKTLLPLALIGGGLWILVEVCFRSLGFLLCKILPNITAAIRKEMLQYTLDHSYGKFNDEYAGSLANKISDMALNLPLILQQLAQNHVPSLASIFVFCFLFAQVDFLFGAVLASWVIIQLTICLSFYKYCSKRAQAHAESRTKLSGQILDALSNHSNVRLFSRQRFELQFMEKTQREEVKKYIQSLRSIEWVKLTFSILCFLGGGVGIGWMMLKKWQVGSITTGQLVFLFNGSWNITWMIWIIGLELPNLFKQWGICQQAMTLMRTPHEITDSPQAKPIEVKKGKIDFNEVSFQYPSHPLLFNKLTLPINPGEKVGIVGFSGAGKTTFANLILRYFDINQGRILIDDQDIAKVTQLSLRENIALIPQDTSLFHRNILENIRYAKPDATDEEVMKAARKAQADEFIKKLPEQYETLVGERGIKLSAGQRQRIAIARAVLKDAPILILDEATSALDSITERMIQDALVEVMKKRTTIVIAHRLSTLLSMDRILVFDKGTILEEGSHESLLKKKGHYYKLWKMQNEDGFIP